MRAASPASGVDRLIRRAAVGSGPGRTRRDVRSWVVRSGEAHVTSARNFRTRAAARDHTLGRSVLPRPGPARDPGAAVGFVDIRRCTRRAPPPDPPRANAARAHRRAGAGHRSGRLHPFPTTRTRRQGACSHGRKREAMIAAGSSSSASPTGVRRGSSRSLAWRWRTRGRRAPPATRGRRRVHERCRRNGPEDPSDRAARASSSRRRGLRGGACSNARLAPGRARRRWAPTLTGKATAVSRIPTRHAGPGVRRRILSPKDAQAGPYDPTARDVDRVR